MSEISMVERMSQKTKIIAAVILLASAGWLCWTLYRNHQHRIIVLFPDGSVASNPIMKLDYDPISYEYHPLAVQGDDRGVIHVPVDRAYGRGWEWMFITASRDGKSFMVKRIPEDCFYPMAVTLEEMPPAPPLPLLKPNKLDELSSAWSSVRRVVEPIIKKLK